MQFFFIWEYERSNKESPGLDLTCFEAFLKFQGYWNTVNMRPPKSQQEFTDLYGIGRMKNLSLSFSFFSGIWSIPEIILLGKASRYVVGV